MRPFALLLALVSFTACAKIKSLVGKGGDSTAVAAEGDSSATSQSGSTSSLLLPVAADSVTDGDLVLTVLTTGLVRSESETPIRSEVSGLVEEILARPGERVTKGQPIVRLSSTDFVFAVREAALALDQALATYREAYQPDSIATGRPPTAERLRAAEQRAGLPLARLRLDRARLDSARSVVRAPFDGIINSINVNIGERINAGALVTIVVDARNLRIEASVLEHDIPFIREGGIASITSPAARNRVAAGRITNVLPIVDSTARAGRVYVRFQAIEGLKPGMYADVRLEAQRLPDRRLVPTRAIIQRDGRDLVFVVKDGRAQWTYIVKGLSNGIVTEVLPDTAGQYVGQIPVNPGDLVIVENHLTLIHDAPVRIVDTREAGSSR